MPNGDAGGGRIINAPVSMRQKERLYSSVCSGLRRRPLLPANYRAHLWWLRLLLRMQVFLASANHPRLTR